MMKQRDFFPRKGEVLKIVFEDEIKSNKIPLLPINANPFEIQRKCSILIFRQLVWFGTGLNG